MHGKIDSDDLLVDTTVEDLALAETYDGGRHRFDGDVVLDRSRRVRLHRPGRPAQRAADERGASWVSSLSA